MPAEWVKGYFTGEMAKTVRGLSHEGIGYKLLGNDDSGSGPVMAAFRRPMTTPLPPNLEKITNEHEIKKLESWRTGE
jgi:hypothetical protein